MFEESLQDFEIPLGIVIQSQPEHSHEIQKDSVEFEKTPENFKDELELQEQPNSEEAEEVCHNKTNEFQHMLLEDETDLDELLAQPLSERWSPLGADNDESPDTQHYINSSQETIISKLDKFEDDTKLKDMEDEQEVLTSSLLALTSHFAHVQLRVRQIVEAPAPARDQLLKDLEEFAFRGVPDMSFLSENTNSTPEDSCNITDKSKQQFQLIQHLKTQLTQLEKLAYESGVPVLPQYMMLEKQKILIDELKQKLNLRVEDQDLPQLSPDELRSQVDNAFGELMGPLKMRDQLVAQLKTQITDLERFIAFLQCDTDDVKQNMEKFSDAYNSYAAKKAATKTNTHNNIQKPTTSSLESNGNNFNNQAQGLLNKASVLMHMFAFTHLGGAQNQFQKNTLKKTDKGNHWGDLRAQLEVDIQEVASLAATLMHDREKLAKIKASYSKTKSQTIVKNSDLTMSRKTNALHHIQRKLVASSDSEEDELNFYYCPDNSNRSLPLHMRNIGGDSIASISKELTTAVRKNFAVTLQRLVEHGLRFESESVASNLIVPFMNCFHPSASTFQYGQEQEECTNQRLDQQMHAWEFIMEYYYLKHGDEFNNMPQRKLMQSFNLDTAECSTKTAKESLLEAISTINALHKPYKRSYNAYFKAFVCEGLNCHKLVDWLHMIFSCTLLVDRYYMPNSYVSRTGFKDSLRSIDALTKYDFRLPVDLAVRHLRSC